MFQFLLLFGISILLLLLQEVEIVLTAHPTQINRRTLQYKHMRIAVSFCPCLALIRFPKDRTFKSQISRFVSNYFFATYTASFGL